MGNKPWADEEEAAPSLAGEFICSLLAGAFSIYFGFAWVLVNVGMNQYLAFALCFVCGAVFGTHMIWQDLRPMLKKLGCVLAERIHFRDFAKLGKHLWLVFIEIIHNPRVSQKRR